MSLNRESVLMDAKLVRFLRMTVKYGYVKSKKIVTVANYDVTGRCNLRCQHCYFFKSHHQYRWEPTDDQWEEIFQEHYHNGIRVAYLTGGEPSLRPNVLRHAHRIFNNVVIVTNGIIKVPQDIQRRLFVSLDGDREVHNAIRGTDCFDEIMKNVKGDQRVVFAPTLSTVNNHLIDKMVEITIQSGTAGICFSLYTSHNADGDPLLLRGDKLKETLHDLEMARQKNPKTVLMSPQMIKLFTTKDHVKHCGFRKGYYASYFPNLEPKEPCVLGKGVDCSTCGCIVPVFITSILKKGDVKGYLIMNRMFRPRYQQRGRAMAQ